MRSISTYTILFILIMLASCEKEFIPEGNESKITLNCLFDNADVIHVYVTESDPLGTWHEFISLSDSKVEILEEDIFKEEMLYVPSDTANTFGSYQSSFIPTPGKRYSLEIKHPLYNSVTVKDEMPLVTVISSAQRVTRGNRNKGIVAVVEISFQDDINTDNFYRLNLRHWLQAYIPEIEDTVEYESHIYFETEESVSDSIRDHGIALLFSDKDFNGEFRTLRLHYRPERYNRFIQVILHVELFTVSKAHFEYFRTLQSYWERDRSNPEWPNVFTNVENGYGIFAGSAVDSVRIVMK